jgi:hypothetical protein
MLVRNRSAYLVIHGLRSGSGLTLLPARPLRTARDSFPSCSSSLVQRPFGGRGFAPVIP